MAHSKPPELDQLRRKNARLIGLLEAHGIAWRSGENRQSEPPPDSAQPAASAPGSAEQKVALFRHLFRGRDNVHALRWQSRSSGRSGYAPACANEWQPVVCEKPRMSCRDCNQRQLLPLSDAVIYGHLAGDHNIGLYPLLENDTCHLVEVDFDEQDWREDARAFLRSCRELAVPAALEMSRSGEGAHVWVFFEEAVTAREARQLGAALISHTCNATRQLQLSSYDRLFPNQDTLPNGGFGNLIALPLHKEARQRLSVAELQTLIQSGTGGAHPLDLAFIDEEDLATPWKPHQAAPGISGPRPTSLTLTLADRLYVERSGLPQPLLNRLIRLSVWDKPRGSAAPRTFLSTLPCPGADWNPCSRWCGRGR